MEIYEYKDNQNFDMIAKRYHCTQKIKKDLFSEVTVNIFLDTHKKPDYLFEVLEGEGRRRCFAGGDLNELLTII